ncbi:hypothetical protein ADUPG1_008927 [Aduncisulcus paluster]|uniref:TFIIS-type domain-containing protein n=1 Tax=Aduncisulcus paluster TaxID=2918883 RepID=A0ABQ5KV13_9EUKA|nr:hypothetical protein ADUPG1_008927 [Aduncisulcus paluster]|eukprot:gnl/Carplike_NY0171/1160_a1572_1015.p1 GENE.gnl/Carplike_NY0171/1160_a1572_1015~~gnl/Carplike_NY0171/1160_a1572_1015.p1  ORF type:complete len:158 (-),score=23.89 gnl/Carplike_NY0171/1160_a1572_1015:188-637(-)
MSEIRDILEKDEDKFQITKFCPDCQKLLDPRISRVVYPDGSSAPQFILKCHFCPYDEPVETQKEVFVRDLTPNMVDRAAKRTFASLRLDPTFPRIVGDCPNCHHHVAIPYQLPTSKFDQKMERVLFCAKCGTEYKEKADIPDGQKDEEE